MIITMAIKDTIAIITVIGTFVVFFTKAIYNFFIANIKRKYREVPGNQSLFDIIVEWISYIGFVLYFIFMIILVKKSSEISSFDIIPKNHNIVTIIIFIVELVIFSAMVYSIYKTMLNFVDLKNDFQDKLKGKFKKMKPKIEINNYIYIIMFIISFVFSTICVVILISSYISFRNTDIIISLNNYDDIKGFLILVSMSFFCGIFLLITINLKEIIKTLKSNDIYVIITDEEIYCKLYLEYNEYYLVIKDNVEKYISKSKVKEIRKIKES